MTTELLDSCADLFARVETRRHAAAVVRGLQSQQRTKNCWSLARECGHSDPWRLQHFFNAAKWDEEALRERVASAAWRHIAPASERVLVFDETGDLKKGTTTPGVQRQYTGTAGRIDNAQVTVYAAWATSDQRLLIDYELYLPRSWTGDPDRLAAAGVPAETAFSTKTEQAQQLLARRLAAGHRPTAIAGDAVYGRSGALRAQAEAAHIAYVLEVGKDKQVTSHADHQAERVEHRARALPAEAWSRRSAGAGAHGQRYYSWSYLALDSAEVQGQRGLLIRHNTATDEYAYYLTYQPKSAPSLARLIRIAGLRWPVETAFQDAKNHFGLDEHQMRTWGSLRRWITLCLLAACAIGIAYHRARLQGSRLSFTGLADLHAAIIQRRHSDEFRYHWSEWICGHNERAKHSHYQRRGDYCPS